MWKHVIPIPPKEIKEYFMTRIPWNLDSPGISRRSFLKKSATIGVAAIAGTIIPWPGITALADGFPIINTSYGKIRGMNVAGIKTFLGIRYGQSTAGANRFMPPVKPQKWNGVDEAFGYGPVSPQKPGDPTDPYTQSTDWDAHVKAGLSEDCLRLNVWTPALDDGGKRPVFFYIHGGGFTSGSGGYPFNGDPMARLGNAVVITVNHRLGPLGFLDLGALGSSQFDKAGVVGMLDLVAALEWVHENIAHFGGDPDNVTIMGQSGGGGKVSILLAMPSAKGLFHKAIIQSGATLTLGSRKRSAESAKNLIDELGIRASNLDDLQQVPWFDIIEADANRRFGPIVDGDVIPTNPCDPVSPEISADVPIIIGNTREDLGFTLNTDSPLTEDGLKEWVKSSYPDNAELILSTYRNVYPNATPYQIQARIATDPTFLKNSITMAERKAALNRGNVYFYIVEWPSPAYGGRFGAVHGVDLGLILANPRNLIAGNTAEARKMAKIIGSSVAAFGKTGDPNCDTVPDWPAYDLNTRATMIFDTECRVENDPTHKLRLLWNNLEKS